MPWVPPLLLLLFAAGAGTFYGGATFAGLAAATAGLLAAVVWGGGRGALGLDPLALGGAGRWWLPALMVVVAASWWVSPVPRAGRLAVLLLPAFLVLPAVVAQGWRDEARRRWGLRGLAAVVALVSCWGLGSHLFLGTPRASQPLGHHNLLAIWLLALLPPAVLPLRERGPWRRLGGLAALTGLAALAATRSLPALLALGALLILAAAVLLRGRWRPPRMPAVRRPRASRVTAAALGLALLAALALALAAPRLAAVASGRDPSARARATYWQGGWGGVVDRPLLGWGPGAVPWTVSRFLEPRPGVNPPGEAVGQLHSLPLQVAYELGIVGLLLSLGVVARFGRRRWRELTASGGARDPQLGWASLAGLTAAGFALLGTAPLSVTAVPLALAVTAGAALAGAEGGPAPEEREGRPVGGARRRSVAAWIAVAYAALAVVLIQPLARAQLHWERSLGREGSAAVEELAAAVALDPGFPLYRAWSAWAGGSGPLGRRAAAEPARQAARDADGVGPLWLAAGVYGLEAGAPWAGDALDRACRLDPLAPLAPFYRMVLDPAAAEAPARGARALLAEPRLLAATFWQGRPALLEAVLARLERWPGVDAGWKTELLATAARLRSREGSSPGAAEERSELAWTLDTSAAESLSLHLFRRRPRAARLVPVVLQRGWAEEVTLPPASTLPETSRRAFASTGCGAPAAL